MSFNLFGTPTTDDIKVGYIDPTLGYVDGVTICQANDYVKDNPGTTFIFKDGDNNLQYLNINEVNNLTPQDLSPKKSDECGGIQQYKECGPPRIQFFGGGGVGATGNPVVGKDGSLLAVDIVTGGNGYQYPPIVAAKDDCQFGNGAVLNAVLGETADETEVYEGEEDFEEYELCEDTDVGYGRKYGEGGQDLGPWEPDLYTKIGEDPIRREIEKFQKALEKPFWTTRKGQPDRITVLGQEYATQNSYSVTDSRWGEFMNLYAVSPVKPSDTTGTDEAGKTFKIEWEYQFPISGEYIFRGVCDNTAKVYIDDNLVGNLKSFKDNPSPLQKTIQEGNHIIRVDLLNSPVEENAPKTSNVSAKFIQKGSGYYLQVDGTGSGTVSFSMDVDDNPNIAGLAAKEVVIPSDGGNISLKRDPSKEKDSDKGSGTFTGGKTYGPIQILGANPAAKGPLPISGSSNKLALRDADGDDKNIEITVINSSSSSTTTTTTGEKIISPKSWNENPMGVSMLIEAPIPPVPQEKLPEQEGKCPPNPIWTTRFPTSTQKWYPVIYPQYKFVQGPNDTNPDILGATAINNALADGLTATQIQEEAQRQGLPLNDNALSLLQTFSTSSNSSESQTSVWSKFMNRYAISPVLPLNTPGSDSSGTTFSNSWEIDLPYAGYYGVKGTRDNNGRLLIDGQEVSKLDSSSVNNPKITKKYLTKGRHIITVEVSNELVEGITIIDTKIFSTQDWRSSPSSSPSSISAKFIQKGSSYYLQVDGTGSGEVSFVMDINDATYIAGLAAKEVIIPSDSGKVKFQRTEYGLGGVLGLSAPTEETIKESGTFTGGKTYGPIEIIGADPAARGPIPITGSSNTLSLRDADGDDKNIQITISGVKQGSSAAPPTSQSSSKNGVTYSGPPLTGYVDKRWSTFMNDFSVSPTPVNEVGTVTLNWKNVNFPEDGTYKFNFQADNIAKLTIGGKEIYTTSDFVGNKVQYTFNATSGKYDISIQLENVKNPSGSNEDNPRGVALYISKDIFLEQTNKTPWTVNPMAVSAILIPPPCAKKIGGKGVVEKVVVNDPGNGYLPPQPLGPGYPVTLVLDDIIVEDPGINYRCGEDQITIVPSNGAELSYNCDSFGRINSVNVLNPGIGFDVYPSITILSETGVNASFRPVFRVVRDPLLPPEKLIQVTDLVGLKQTGYVDGRAYYGAVYYDQGVPYAGYYKTAGTQVRVYATLQESITAKVTTPPSAIQRSGTDIRSNDPRLNIPGTPQSTTEQT